MNDQTSQTSSGQLHEAVQRWIWAQGWDKLRPIQEQAIAPILCGNTALIISAATAEGKTEAAFLPIFSRLLQQPAPGIRVLGISPGKALINDQRRKDWGRLAIAPFWIEINEILQDKPNQI